MGFYGLPRQYPILYTGEHSVRHPSARGKERSLFDGGPGDCPNFRANEYGTVPFAAIGEKTVQPGDVNVNYEQLWAPWRMDYILGQKPEERPIEESQLLPGADRECFLCRAVPDGDDRQWCVVHRGRLTITVLNRYPYNNGHLLIAPQRHLGNLEDLDDATHLELMQTLTRMVGILKKTIEPQGFNVGLNLGRPAGAGLPDHLHWHVVPRWIGDTHFMPILAGIRVIPQSLEALWELIRGALTD
jgi:ATP adenylyltransferase